MRRREIEQHRQKLGEIRNIMSSMKNLALMETRKLARFLAPQQAVVADLERVAEDFLAFHPQPEGSELAHRHFVLLVGSERGFCGDFNERLLKEAMSTDGSGMIIVGHKLRQRLGDATQVVASLDGPSVAEEISAVLNQLVSVLVALQQANPGMSVEVIYHRDDRPDPVGQSLLPPFSDFAEVPPRHTLAAVMNMPPSAFFAELVQAYLFAVLYEIFYLSLMAENNRRVQHMDSAVNKLDDKLELLGHQAQAARQEEITEEIEVILLGADSAPVTKSGRLRD